MNNINKLGQFNFFDLSQKGSGDTFTILSMGWGQDSVTMLIMYITDFLGFREKYAPNRFAVIFSNTGDEKEETYNYIKYFAPTLIRNNIEFHIITSEKGMEKIDKSLHSYCRTGFHPRTWQTLEDQYERNNVVMSLLGGKKSCTDNLKIKPIYNFVNTILENDFGYRSSKKINFESFAIDYGKINVLIGYAKGEERRVKTDKLEDKREILESFLCSLGTIRPTNTQMTAIESFYTANSDSIKYKVCHADVMGKVKRIYNIEMVSSLGVFFFDSEAKFVNDEGKKIPNSSVRKYPKYSHLKSDHLYFIPYEDLISVDRSLDFMDLGIEKVFPLIDYGFNRTDCQSFISENGFNVPMPSACAMCPFQCEATLVYQYRLDPSIIEKMKMYEAAKIKKSGAMNAGTKKANHGIFKLPISEWLENCLGKYGHLETEELRQIAMSHGHNITNSY